jgi:prepilin-type N-terminal cleavage/methylation domain-containing protein
MQKTARATLIAGFTLIELLIVVSIISIVSAAAIPGFSGYIRTQNLKQSMEQLKSDLRTAQVRALAGSLSDDDQVGYWSVDFTFDQGSYTYSTYPLSGDTSVVRGESEPLLSDIVIRDTSEPTIMFRIPNGDAYNASRQPCNVDGSNCRVVLGPLDVTGDRCAAVMVNTAGGIFKEEGVACE